MNEVSIVTVRLLLHQIGQNEVLAGAANGSAVLSLLVAQVHKVTSATVAALDFGGVSVATGSFLRECVLGFRDYCRRSQPDLYPVAANLNELVLEELRYLLRQERKPIVCCDLTEGGLVVAPRVEGVLEEKQLLTLNAVIAAGETDAGTLAEQFSSTEKISVTGWNNRLASLAAEGLLIETRSGRTKRYRPVVEGLQSGN